MMGKRCLGSLFLALGIVSVAAAAESVLPAAWEKAQEYYQQGKKAIAQGNYTQANEFFSKAELALNRSVPADAAGAQETAPAAGGPAANPPDFYYNLGIGFLRNGNFSAAEGAFIKAVSLRPDDPRYCYQLGILYENHLNRPAEAIKYYLRYVNLVPDAADAVQVRRRVETLQAESKK